MKISCIIPIYNTQRYLRKCINSVLAQSYQNFEIVLVNDCSKDYSVEICRGYVRKYPGKVVLIDKKVNEGVDKARFSGIEYVMANNPTGGVIFIDSDDYIDKDSFFRLVSEMERTGADVVEMYIRRVWGMIRKKNKYQLKPQFIEQPRLFEEYYRSFFGINILGVNMWGKLYKSEAIARAHLQPSGFKMGEDLLFNLKLFPYLSSYAIIDYYGYNYRIGGLTSNYNPFLWEDLKAQFYIKRSEALAHGYHCGLRSLSFELKNILLSALEQRMIYLQSSEKENKEWLVEVLADETLWEDIRRIASDLEVSDPMVYAIASGDADAILVRVRQRLKAGRWRRLVKRILSYVIR